MKAVSITDNLFQVEFEVQLKNSLLYEELFPIRSNSSRYNKAVAETKTMVRRACGEEGEIRETGRFLRR